MQPGVCEATGCMLMLGAELMVIASHVLACMHAIGLDNCQDLSACQVWYMFLLGPPPNPLPLLFLNTAHLQSEMRNVSN